MSLAPGTRIGAYEILAPLGAGGMGEVYRARDARLGREVALKVLLRDVASHPDRLARFEREAKAVAALNHPNIVTLHSIEEADGIRFLTMELVEGQGLERIVAAGGLPIPRILALAIPLADALVAAHERGVVHRDLKPANVMVTRDGRVKVLDFGLAKLSAAEPTLEETRAVGAGVGPVAAAPISVVGQAVGTVPYMAPEQLRGEPVDARTDLFAFGVILYELVSGRRPFVGTSSADVGSAILRDTPPAVQDLRGDLPNDLQRIIGRCLEKDRERRFQTAKDVRNELELVRGTLASSDPGARASALSAASGVAGAGAGATTSAAATLPRSAPDVPGVGTPDAASRPAAAPAADVPSIAVLPLVNRSRDEEDEYFADGLADELLTVLAKIRGLRVAARSSAFTFKGKEATVAEVGRALNVATVLEGSVRKSGPRVRISVQLVKVSDGYQLWSETYDRTLEDIFAVQDDIAQSVVKELRTTLLGEVPDSKTSGEMKAEVAAAAKGRGESGEAHRLFLQGRFLIERLGHGDIEKGIEYLQEAVRVDPGHALAWAWLSRGRSHAAGYGLTSVTDGYAAARAAAQRALALEPDLAEGHLALGMIQLLHDWDWKGADASYRRALELAPGSADALRAAGGLACDLGRVDEAIALGRRAVAQDPLSPGGHNALAQSYRMAGRMAEAEAAYQRSLEISPHRVATRMMLSVVLFDQGRIDEARAVAEQESAEWARLTSLAVIEHAAGRRAESDQALRVLIEKYAADAALQIGAVHALRGETEAAFEWLERAYDQRDAGLAAIKLEPALASLRSDPRWGALLRKIGLAD